MFNDTMKTEETHETNNKNNTIAEITDTNEELEMLSNQLGSQFTTLESFYEMNP